MADRGCSDAELVAVTRAGSKDAFGQLADRYYRMVSILACQKIKSRSDVEDVVQEAFVRAYRALDSLREPWKFGGWLYHIALQICLDRLRGCDAVLVQCAQAGNREAFCNLAERHYRDVALLLSRLAPDRATDEDLIREVFTRAYERLTTLVDPARFGAWLEEIAVAVWRERG
ncbi:hypothetical protein HY251_21680 [bacterium]|nr:hypothetical protein [bacterium]